MTADEEQSCYTIIYRTMTVLLQKLAARLAFIHRVFVRPKFSSENLDHPETWMSWTDRLVSLVQPGYLQSDTA